MMRCLVFDSCVPFGSVSHLLIGFFGLDGYLFGFMHGRRLASGVICEDQGEDDDVLRLCPKGDE